MMSVSRPNCQGFFPVRMTKGGERLFTCTGILLELYSYRNRRVCLFTVSVGAGALSARLWVQGRERARSSRLGSLITSDDRKHGEDREDGEAVQRSRSGAFH